jgi:hypothetical protein
VGSPCSTKGDTCGTRSSLNCGVIEVCDDHDPRGGPGGCPISSAKFKNDIRYIDENLLERLHDETMQMRLASPQRLAVDPGLGRVDLYGYLSMVVAAVQVQEKEIADLRQQLGDPRAKSVCGAYQSR